MEINTLNMRTGNVLGTIVTPTTKLKAVRDRLLPVMVQWDPEQVQFFLAKHTDTGEFLVRRSDDALALLKWGGGKTEIRPPIQAMLREPCLDMESTIQDVFGADFAPTDRYAYLLYLPPHRCLLLRWYDLLVKGVPSTYSTFG